MIHGGDIYGKTIEYDLSVNLNPNPCPESVKKALVEASKKVAEYPDPLQRDFRKAVAAIEGENIGADNVIGGNGASELLMAIVRYLEPKKALLPIPSFYGYRHALNQFDNCEVITHRLMEEKGFVHDEALLDRIDDGIDLLILANPNNPTGRCINPELMKRIAQKCNETGTALLIDECFLRLSSGGESAAKYVGTVPDIFIVNAYTKLFSIPGVRVGYALANAKDIMAIKRFLPEWNMSVYAQEAGIACANEILNSNFLEDSITIIEEKRSQTKAKLDAIGIRAFGSDTCFLLIKSDQNLYDLAMSRGILIRDCSNFEGLGQGYYRISLCGSLTT